MAKKKTTTKRAKARKTAKRKATRRRTTSASPAASIMQPTALVRDMKSYRSQLSAQRDKLDSEINAIDRALAELGRSPSPRGTTRTATGGRTRAGSLKDFIEQVLKSGQVMTVKDITSSVLKSGFKTRNKTLGTSVGIALSQMTNVKKVARGKYARR